MSTERRHGEGREPVESHRRLAAEIKRRRLGAGLTHGTLALKATYSREYVGRAERPEAGFPSALLVEKIDEALAAGGELVALHRQAAADRLARRMAHNTSDAATPAPAPTVVPTTDSPWLHVDVRRIR